MIGGSLFVFIISFNLKYGFCSNLWAKGVVHYAINPKDYDVHSQDVMKTTFNLLQKEICLKFFNTPFNYSNGENSYKVLYITNPDKRKSCTPSVYNYNSSVVDMVIGYKCLDQPNIAATVVDMLKASILQTDTPKSSFDSMMRLKSMTEDNRPGVLTPEDRNYINAHYHHECGTLDKPLPLLTSRRRSGALRPEELQWYQDRLWPMGVIMYTVEPELRGSPEHSLLKYAMTSIEVASCIVFQYHDHDDYEELEPTRKLQFGVEGEEAAALGVLDGGQQLNLTAFTVGAPGHTAHALNNLMRVLGVPMMSNRHDRDNHVGILWENVAPGKGHFLEKAPEAAWIQSMPYDWTSVTHAPANFMCADCSRGERTVAPLQEHLWQRTLSIGHTTSLSETDRDILYMLYNNECRLRSPGASPATVPATCKTQSPRAPDAPMHQSMDSEHSEQHQ